MTEEMKAIYSLALKDVREWENKSIDTAWYSVRRTVFIELFKALAKSEEEFVELSTNRELLT